MKVNINMENHTHELHVYIQALKGELETLCQALGNVSQITYMDNQLKKFEELLLDNAQTLVNKNLKWKEW